MAVVPTMAVVQAKKAKQRAKSERTEHWSFSQVILVVPLLVWQ